MDMPHPPVEFQNLMSGFLSIYIDAPLTLPGLWRAALGYPHSEVQLPHFTGILTPTSGWPSAWIQSLFWLVSDTSAGQPTQMNALSLPFGLQYHSLAHGSYLPLQCRNQSCSASSKGFRTSGGQEKEETG